MHNRSEMCVQVPLSDPGGESLRGRVQKAHGGDRRAVVGDEYPI